MGKLAGKKFNAAKRIREREEAWAAKNGSLVTATLQPIDDPRRPTGPNPIEYSNRMPGRNQTCPCNSGRKFKHCCSPTASYCPKTGPGFIDSGEPGVRWVICDNAGTSLFADKDNRALVFADKALAYAIASSQLFEAQAPGEINVASVGATKWADLQAKLPFVEVPDVETALALIQERIAHASQNAANPS